MAPEDGMAVSDAVGESPPDDGLRERLADLDAVYRLADAIGRAEDLGETLDAAIDALVAALALDRASILLADEAGVMRFRAWRGLSDGYRAATEGHSPWSLDEAAPEPVLVPDVFEDDELAALRETIAAEGIRALAFVPLVHRGRLLGKFMLYRDVAHDWTGRELQLALAMATHVAAASERHRAQARLAASESQLAVILRQVADGVTVQAPDGSLVYANDAAARMLGFDSAAALLAAPLADVLGRFEILDEHRRPLPPDRLPGRLALAGRPSPETLVCYRIRATGEERWSVVRASPVRGAGGDVEFAVNTFHDITERKLASDRLSFLAEAGDVLASSLDPEQTLATLSQFAIPALGDWCVIDVLEPDGSLRRVGAAHVDPAKASLLDGLEGPRGYRGVVASGEPFVMPEIDEARLRQAARSDEHFERLRALEPHSLVCVPLVSRGRTLGALTLVSSNADRRYGDEEVGLAAELGRRAALAVDNALLFDEAERSLSLLDGFLASAPVAIGFFDRELRYVRVNDVLAELNGVPVGEHAGRSLQEVVPDIAPILEPIYRRVLETGEAVEREESSADLTPRLGADRHLLSRYFPVRAADGDVVGVGVLIADITERRRLAEKQAFLAEAGAALSASLDYEETLRAVARLAVPRIADWCVVYECDDDGSIRRLAVEHAGGQAERVAAILDRHPLDPSSQEGVPAVVRTGETWYEPDLSLPDLTSDTLGGDELARELDWMELRSYVCAPLTARGRTLGAIALITADSGRALAEDEVALVEELARRAGLAVDNARLFRAAESAAELERRRGEQLLRLSHAALVINSSSSLDEMLAALTAQARDIVGVEGAATRLGGGGGEAAAAITSFAGSPRDASPAPAGAELDDERVAQLVRERNRPVRLDRRLAAPLVGRDGRNLGVIQLSDKREGDFDAEDEAILVQLAQMASIAVENTRLYDESRGSLALVDALLATAPVGFAFVDTDLRFVRVNEALAEMNGVAVEEHLGRRPSELDGLAEVERLYAEVRDTGEPILDREVSVGGRDFHSGYFPVRSSDGELLGVGAIVLDVTARRRAEERLRFLAEASSLLASSLDYDETLRRVGELAEASIADWLVVYLLSEDGELTRNVVSHVGPVADEDVRELVERYPPRLVPESPLTRVVEEGESALIPALDDEVLERIAQDERHLELMRRAGFGSVVLVPLRAAGRTLGALALVRRRESPPFDEADVPFAEELARRAAVAVDNARLYEAASFRETLLRSQSEASIDGLLLVAPDGAIMSHNRRYAEMWGIPEEVLASGSDDAAVSHALELVDDPDEFRERIAAVYERGAQQSHDTLRLRDGRVIERHGTPVLDPDGTYRGYLWSFRDVTESRRAQEEQRYQSELTRTILENAVSALFLMDESGRPTFMNAAAREMFGFELDEIAGEPLHYAVHHTRPDGRHYPMEECPIDRALPEQKWVEPYEDVFIRKDGTFFPVRAAASPIFREGRAVGTVVEVQDVTAQKEAERQLRERAQAAEALEFVGDGVVLLDRTGTIRLWNPAAEAATGLRADDVVGRPADRAIPNWPALASRVPVSVAGREGIVRAETLPLEIDGREVWLSISAVEFEGGWVYAFRDVTEERGIEKMKSDFVSTVSHELRTPLAAIYGAALTLRREDLPLPEEQRAGLLAVIADESDRLARIVNDILWTSRIEAGVLQVSIESCDPRDLVRTVAQAARLHLPPRIELEVKSPDEAPLVAADPDKVRQVLTNLVDNAVKYSPDGGTVVLCVEERPGMVRFVVRDEGLGIPPAERERVFEKFYRLDPNLNRGVGGTGLGLYICRELVRRMGGWIWVEGNEPRGTTVVVELPVVGEVAAHLA